MPPFPHDTFVVADVPPALEQHVRAIRRQYGSARQFLPVEITIAGSSGVGVFAGEQDATGALSGVARVAAQVAPFDIELSAIERFPRTGVFYYAIRDPAPLVALHRRLVSSGLRFAPSPFPFSPHLTIDTFDDAGAELEAELRALAVPAGPQRIERMSVYSLNGWDCRLVQAFPLEGHAGRATPSPRG